jgi:hypothetical protein
MKTPMNFWNRLKSTIYEKYGRESGKIIVHAGVITWITASISQVVAIMMNDKISSNQKKFLIPQEIADGALNVLTFYLITNTLKNVSSKLVSTGKWSTKAIRDFVASKNIKMGDISTDLGKTFKENKEFHDAYDKFKGGMDMIATSTGSVISCNAITPFIRNHFGAEQQKKSINKEQMQKKAILKTFYTSSMDSYLVSRGLLKI